MSVEVLTQNLQKQLFASFRKGEKNIRIISPFLSEKMAAHLITITKQYHIPCEIITRFSLDDFWSGASDLNAIERLLCVGINVYQIDNIHTKLYLIDNQTAFVGSANFTNRGLNPKHELELEMLIKIYDDPNTITELNQYFLDNRVEKAIISHQMIEQAKEELSIHPPSPKPPKFHKYSYEKPIEKLTQKQRIWIKFEDSSQSPADRAERITASRQKTTNFSLRRKPVKFSEGDILFIAKHSKDSKGKPMPIIVARANCHKFDPSQKLQEETQWPYYLNLYNVKTIEGPVSNGIELRELIEDIGNETYINTVGDNRSTEDLMHTHRQQASRELTEKAKEYLDHKLGFNSKD